MSPRNRANKAIYKAIKVLSAQCRQFSTMDIARISTYSQPTVIQAIQELEAAGVISVERTSGMRNRYIALREMDHE